MRGKDAFMTKELVLMNLKNLMKAVEANDGREIKRMYELLLTCGYEVTGQANLPEQLRALF